MTESGELLRKADALLGRYGKRSHPEADADFPVLTEIVEPAEPELQSEAPQSDPVLTDVVDRIEPQWPVEPGLPAEAREDTPPPSIASAPGQDPSAAREAPVQQALHEALTQQLRDSLARQLPEVLAPALQEIMQERLDKAMSELSARMRQEVDSMVHSAVEQAIHRTLESLEREFPPV